MSVTLESVVKAHHALKGIVRITPLQYNEHLSERYDSNIYLKREDLQPVRSYKIRGAYYFLSLLTDEQKINGIVTTSAGNHAQGVAYSCKLLGIKGKIFVPLTTPTQKIERTKKFGNAFVEVEKIGDTFDDTQKIALKYAREQNAIYVPPFDHEAIISGQGTIALEVIEELRREGKNVDCWIVPVGGGGLISGVSLCAKSFYPNSLCLGVESEDASSMAQARKEGRPITLEKISTFVEGTAVKRVGNLTFNIAQKYVDDIVLVPEGKVCSTMINLYNNEGIVTEPAGALSVAALDSISDKIKRKNVVCIISGGNNDWGRLEEIEERSLLYEGLKHYFIIEFPQRPGALRSFLDDVLGENDDITRFEYMKKTNKEFGPALVGIQLQKKADYAELKRKLETHKIRHREITHDETLFNYLV